MCCTKLLSEHECVTSLCRFDGSGPYCSRSWCYGRAEWTLFGVAKQVVFEDSGLVPGCPLPPLLESDSWTVDLPSVCLGLCIGLLIGPLLDLGFLTDRQARGIG